MTWQKLPRVKPTKKEVLQKAKFKLFSKMPQPISILHFYDKLCQYIQNSWNKKCLPVKYFFLGSIFQKTL